jgi:hypothetical protein
MYWVIAALALVLAFAVPKFRRAGVIVGVVLLALLGWAIERSNPWAPSPEATQEREASRSLPGPRTDSPPLNAVSAQQLQLNGSGAPWTLTGRLTNTSQRYRISAVTLKIERRDCYPAAPDPTGCVVQWQGADTVFVSLPPGEWREFSSPIWLHGSLPRTHGETRDGFEITAVEGRVNSNQ